MYDPDQNFDECELKLDELFPAKSTKPPPPDFLEELRSAAFSQVKVRDGTKIRSLPRIDALLESLSAPMRNGDIGAIREQRHYSEYLKKKDALAKTKIAPEDNFVAKLIAENDKHREIMNKILAVSYLELCRLLVADYFAKNGHIPEFPFRKPEGFTLEPIRKYPRYTRKFLQDLVSGPDANAEVGYGKPPISTRFKKKQSGNPSGKRKAPAGGWNSYRAGLLRRVPVITDGRKTKLTSAAITGRRVFDLAIKGNPAARREARKIVLELDAKGLMTPPPPRPRRKRSRACVPDELKKALGSQFRLEVIRHKKQMEETYRRVYGPNPTFVEDAEREFQARWADFRSAAAALKQTRRGADRS